MIFKNFDFIYFMFNYIMEWLVILIILILFYLINYYLQNNEDFINEKLDTSIIVEPRLYL